MWKFFSKIQEKAPAEVEVKEAVPKGEGRILLVDDDTAIVRIVSRMLERLGYSVVGMTDSVAALERFRSDPDEFDLVITDMSMPLLAGDQLAIRLLKVRGDIPILLCTGHSDTMDEEKAKEIGIRGFAMKPLNKGDLASPCAVSWTVRDSFKNAVVREEGAFFELCIASGIFTFYGNDRFRTIVLQSPLAARMPLAGQPKADPW